jgi:hypothetical protein
MPTIPESERSATFDYYLRRAIFFGERHEVSCIGLNSATWRAIGVVAREFPNVNYESVLFARKVFETPVDMNALVARYRQSLPDVDLTARQRKNRPKR